MSDAPAPMSLRAYARRRGVSAESVSKAIAAGRLRESVVTVNGQPKIADAETADREWAENTQPRANDEQPDDADLDVPNYNVSRARREAHAARRESAMADLAEIEVEEKLGELVSANDAKTEVMKRYGIVRTKMLGIPSMLVQRIPGLAVEVRSALEELLREGLEELTVEVERDS